MIAEKGRVLDVRGGIARIEILHGGGSCCSSCGFCNSLEGQEKLLELPAPEGLQPGDVVTLRITLRSAAGAASARFAIPLVLLIGGALVGAQFFPVETEGQVNLAALALGAGLMVLWYIGVSLHERRRGQIKPAAPTITHIEHPDH